MRCFTRHEFALHYAAIIYGSQHVIIKLILNKNPYSILISTVRFSLSSICSMIVLYSCKKCTPVNNETISLFPNSHSTDSKIFFKGIELGLYTFGGFALQTLGLKYTTATRSAYLLYLNVKIVPILKYIFCKKIYPYRVWISVFFAALGTMILALDDHSTGGRLNIGDVLSFSSAIVSSCFIIRADNDLCDHDLLKLNTFTLTSTSLYFFVVSCFTYEIYHVELMTSSCLWIYMSYIILIVTCLGQYLQFYGQTHISPEKSALIFALDPVYNMIFSFIILEESFTIQGIIGILFILIGVITNHCDYSIAI